MHICLHWGHFGGQCRHIWQSHGVSGIHHSSSNRLGPPHWLPTRSCRATAFAPPAAPKRHVPPSLPSGQVQMPTPVATTTTPMTCREAQKSRHHQLWPESAGGMICLAPEDPPQGWIHRVRFHAISTIRDPSRHPPAARSESPWSIVWLQHLPKTGPTTQPTQSLVLEQHPQSSINRSRKRDDHGQWVTLFEMQDFVLCFHITHHHS